MLGRRHYTGVLVRSGYSSIYILLPRIVSYANGVPSHIWLDGLQRQRTLKTCFSEFHHITSAPFSYALTFELFYHCVWPILPLRLANFTIAFDQFYHCVWPILPLRLYYCPSRTRSASPTSSVRQRMRFLYLPVSTRCIINGQTGTSSVQNFLPIKIIGEA